MRQPQHARIRSGKFQSTSADTSRVHEDKPSKISNDPGLSAHAENACGTGTTVGLAGSAVRSKLSARALAVFEMLEAAAVSGARCPDNDAIHGHMIKLPCEGGPKTASEAVRALALAGAIRVRMFAGNVRAVEILVGEHAGKSTERPPRGKAIKIIDAGGTRRPVRRR